MFTQPVPTGRWRIASRDFTVVSDQKKSWFRRRESSTLTRIVVEIEVKGFVPRYERFASGQGTWWRPANFLDDLSFDPDKRVTV